MYMYCQSNTMWCTHNIDGYVDVSSSYSKWKGEMFTNQTKSSTYLVNSRVLYHKSFNPYQLYFNFQEYVYCNIFIITYILNHKSVDGIYN